MSVNAKNADIKSRIQVGLHNYKYVKSEITDWSRTVSRLVYSCFSSYQFRLMFEKVQHVNPDVFVSILHGP